MKTDLQKTQHYTTNYDLIFDGLLDIIPAAARLVEPFVGHGDLLTLFPNHIWETYDIDSSLPCVCQDTLKNPPAYAGRWVITNPPFWQKITHPINHIFLNMIMMICIRFFSTPSLGVKAAL